VAASIYDAAAASIGRRQAWAEEGMLAPQHWRAGGAAAASGGGGDGWTT